MFRAGRPDASLFDPPSGCLPGTFADLRMVSIPQVSTVKPYIPAAHVPAFASQFKLVLEAKLNANALTVSAMRWAYDGVDRLERIDYVGTDARDVHLIYDRSRDILWNVSSTGCTTSVASSAPANPLYTRAGSLPALFGNTAFFAAAKSMGRTGLARGVSSDVFTAPAQRLTNSYTGAVYNFGMDVLFFPDGWQFPGRSLPGNLRVPLRVVNNGSVTLSTGQKLSYVDTFDLFQYLPVAPERALFDAVALYQCAPEPPSEPIFTGTDRDGHGGTPLSCCVSIPVC
jgi:hypothetical protein